MSMSPIVEKLLRKCGMLGGGGQRNQNPCNVVLKDFYISQCNTEQLRSIRAHDMTGFPYVMSGHVRGTLSINDGIHSAEISFEAGSLVLGNDASLLEALKQKVDDFKLV